MPDSIHLLLFIISIIIAIGIGYRFDKTLGNILLKVALIVTGIMFLNSFSFFFNPQDFKVNHPKEYEYMNNINWASSILNILGIFCLFYANNLFYEKLKLEKKYTTTKIYLSLIVGIYLILVF